MAILGGAYTATVTTSAQTTSNWIWTDWNQDITSTSVWRVWTTASSATNIDPVIYTPEQDAACRAAIERNRVATEQRQAKVVEVNNRAESLLLAHLSPAQAEQYKKRRCFEVLITRDGKIRRYEIEYGWAGNVRLLDEDGRALSKFCIHPTKHVPYADNLLAQKLLLEANEDEFLRIANETRIRIA